MRKPAEVFPPSAFIQEELEVRGWTYLDLVERSNLCPLHATHLIKGDRPITQRAAYELAQAFGISAEFWLNLQQTWHDYLMSAEC